MGPSDISKISKTLIRLAAPDMKPKKLLKAVRKEHPKASKSDIVRGAFMALIVHADQDPEKAKQIHDFALTERGSDEA